MLLLVALVRLLESAVLLPFALVLPPAHLLLSYEVVVHCWVQSVSPSLMHCIFTALVVFRPRLGLPLPHSFVRGFRGQLWGDFCPLASLRCPHGRRASGNEARAQFPCAPPARAPLGLGCNDP